MNKRNITLEYEENYYSLLENLAVNFGYQNMQDYLDTIIAVHVFDALEQISGLGNSMELKRHLESTEGNSDDGMTI